MGCRFRRADQTVHRYFEIRSSFEVEWMLLIDPLTSSVQLEVVPNFLCHLDRRDAIHVRHVQLNSKITIMSDMARRNSL
jgi:hypothetical protein